MKNKSSEGKKELNKFEVEFILGQIIKLEKDHPKARVVYDVDKRGVYIYYPLPEDFYKLNTLKL